MNKQYDWDKYFMNLCIQVSKNSKCLSRQIGAVIVKDKSLVSTGYNGPPRGIPHCGIQRYERDKELQNAIDNIQFDYGRKQELIWTECPRQLLGYKSGEGLEWCIAAHAERNAIVDAARRGSTRVKGATMYMNCPVPCAECLKEILNAGIIRIVCTSLSYYDKLSAFLIRESGIEIQIYEEKKNDTEKESTE